jgi:hypothetical protein
VSLALSPRSEESWLQVLASLELLGDELVDTFLVLLAVALETNGPERITLAISIVLRIVKIIFGTKLSLDSSDYHV